MTRNIRPRGEDIRAFILRNVDSEGLAGKVVEKFGITRQAANRHLQKLTNEGALKEVGRTSGRMYKLAAKERAEFEYEITPDLEEDVVWKKDIRPFIGSLPESVLEIWHYAFTEMFNNAIDHSGGTTIMVSLIKTAVNTELWISDNGVGIFKKIQEALKLPDERQAIFELSKGKLTTDAKNHSGQGIFFTSRMVNEFDILSGGVYFSHEIGDEADWMLEQDVSRPGTTVFLNVENHTARSVGKVYKEFTAKGSYDFSKTIVPVKLAKYGTDQLVSRSQAKRVLARIDLFKQVIFNFSGVDTIGQAFADQIFRVFAQEHPDVKMHASHANKEILGMISAAVKSGRPGFKGQTQAGLFPKDEQG